MDVPKEKVIAIPCPFCQKEPRQYTTGRTYPEQMCQCITNHCAIQNIPIHVKKWNERKMSATEKAMRLLLTNIQACDEQVGIEQFRKTGEYHYPLPKRIRRRITNMLQKKSRQGE